jgi:hypothetical protein
MTVSVALAGTEATSFVLLPEPGAEVDERRYPPPRPVIWRSADRSG